jgi:hypothetical protein
VCLKQKHHLRRRCNPDGFASLSRCWPSLALGGQTSPHARDLGPPTCKKTGASELPAGVDGGGEVPRRAGVAGEGWGCSDCSLKPAGQSAAPETKCRLRVFGGRLTSWLSPRTMGRCLSAPRQLLSGVPVGAAVGPPAQVSSVARAEHSLRTAASQLRHTPARPALSTASAPLGESSSKASGSGRLMCARPSLGLSYYLCHHHRHSC